MSQEASSLCLNSLTDACNQIKAKAGKQDALLFYVKHLIVLREEVAQFNSSFTQTQSFLDFSEVIESVSAMMNRRSSGGTSGSNSNLIMDFVQMSIPKIVEQKLDAKKVNHIDSLI